MNSLTSPESLDQMDHLETRDIFGKIFTVGSLIDNTNKLKIVLLGTTNKVDVVCPALPYKKDDNYYSLCTTDSSGTLRPVGIPHITVSCCEESIKKFLLSNLDKSDFSEVHNIYDYLYDTSDNKDGKNERVVFNKLTDLSVNHIRDSVSFNIFKNFKISDFKYRDILYHWYIEKVIRQIELLGLTKEEFEDYHPDSSMSFVEECKKNSYKIYTISMDKARHINIILNKKVPKIDRDCGVLVRKIYELVKSRGSSGVPEIEMKENFAGYSDIINHAVANFGVIAELNTVYLSYYAKVESKLAESMVPKKGAFPDSIEPENYDKLSSDQREAIEFAMNQKVSLITGSAGTGKTTMIKSFVSILSQMSLSYLIVSFTGKAVARIKEIIGKNSNVFTIHRAVAKDISAFQFLIIDEISMVSNNLLYMFFNKYNPEYYKIIAIGDPNQLVPIDWGDLIGQLKISIPCYKLTTQHRQESQDLVELYDKILNKQSIAESICSDNFSLINGKHFKVYDILKELKKSNVCVTDVVVITHLNRDVDIMNPEIQKIFSGNNLFIIEPKDTEQIHPEVIKDAEKDNAIPPGYRAFYVNDKVMMTENNYDNDIFNGDEGIVKYFNSEDRYIAVKFGDREEVKFYLNLPKMGTVMFHKNRSGKLNSKTLKHSFAITAHKSQGSEWPYVIFYVEKWNSGINNNIIYTTLTRAKKRAWVIGSANDIEKGITSLLNKRLDNVGLRINNLISDRLVRIE